MPRKGIKWKNTDKHWSKGPNAAAIIEKANALRVGQKSGMAGKIMDIETRHKISKAKKESALTRRGDKHPHWKGGVVKIHNRLRNSLEYNIWRNAVYKKNNWSCTECGIKCEAGNIIAHHIKKFADFPEYRFDVDNGITLCRKCHINIEHPSYITVV